MTTPAHAAKFWLTGDTLNIEFPSTRTDKVHTVTFPANPQGFLAVLSILKARDAHSTVATKGAPTKAQVEKDLEKMAEEFLRGGKVKKARTEKFSPELRKGVVDVLREVGII